MSVIGIDFGNESCFVAVARAGGIETVDNDYSLRATSSTVAFGEKNRILGVPAKNQLVTNIKNTLWSFKRFLGRKFEDPFVQDEIKTRRLPFQVLAHPQTGGVAFRVRYLGEERVFTAEQASAMLLTKLKETTEHGLGMKVSDCVLSVPSFFTDVERRALLAAAQMAGLNVLRLLNETTATALTYGIYKQDLPEENEKARNVVFVDAGHSSLQVWVSAFNKGKLKVLVSASDPFLGGRDFDAVLAEHFCAEFRTKYKIDCHKNARAYIRLLTEVEKLKKQMSANATKLPINIECLMDDKDVNSSYCRADFEVLAAPLFQRAEKTMMDCLKGSNLTPEEIYSVEIVGGSSRIPAIKSLIEKVFGKSPSTTLNQDEAVARGCALQCALLSPAYKIRPFKIADVQPYPIRIQWNENLQDDGLLEVFPLYHPVPFSRMLTFYKAQGDFKFKALYASKTPFPSMEIGDYVVKNIPPGEDGEAIKIKIKARITMDGIFNICSAIAYEKSNEEQMEVEEVKVPTAENGKVAPPEGQEAATEGGEKEKKEGGNEPMEAQENQNGPLHNGEQEAPVPVPPQGDGNGNTEMEVEGSASQEEVGEKGKKVLYKTIDLPLDCRDLLGLAAADVGEMTAAERKMIQEDKREKERVDAKNALEEFVYLLREKLEGDYAPFVDDRGKSALLSDCSSLENWIYEDGAEENRVVYVEKLEKLRKSVEPIATRHYEYLESLKPKPVPEEEKKPAEEPPKADAEQNNAEGQGQQQQQPGAEASEGTQMES